MYSIKWDRFGYSSAQFGLWRMIFGFYLAFFFVRIFPYRDELYSDLGPFVNSSFIQHKTFFPEALLTHDSSLVVQILLSGSILLALLIMVGWYRRFAALVLWLFTLWFYNRNPLTDSPEYGFINWLIFACIFIPSGERWSIGPKNPNWKMPRLFYWGAWIVLGVAYFYAASSKFRSKDMSWMDGTAMYYVFAVDNARLDWYGKFFDQIPRAFYIPITYAALILQGLSPVFIAIRSLRPTWWMIATLVHVLLLFFVNLGELTLGMILFHLFLFDHRWLDLCLKRDILKIIRNES